MRSLQKSTVSSKKLNIPVIFEDEYLLILDKPPSLAVTSAETQKEETLEDILRSAYQIKAERSGIIHRLDKDTSGLLVVAKTPEVLQSLQAQFKAREVRKEYLALVHGFIREKGKVVGAIIRNPANREKFIVQPHRLVQGEAKPAVTEYEPIEKFKIQNSKFKIIFEGFNKIQMRKLERLRYGEFTLLKCKPLTGRTHQIRVHLKYSGFPIVGDEKYGGRKTVRLDHRWCKRQFLHAAKLEFIHPRTGKIMSFESPLPEDLQSALEILSPWNQTA